MLYDDLPKILKNFSESYQRQEAAQDLLNYFWPEHDVIWINSTVTYDNIEKIISSKNRDIIILQTEEDWFKMLDVVKARKKIVACKNWTENSFVITNSEYDCQISKPYINIIHKPGIFDLICYKPYRENLNFDSIKYHTAFNYNRKDLTRSVVAKFLTHYKDNVCSLLYDNNEIINHKNIDIRINKGEVLDSPFVEILKDKRWSELSAFHTVIETFNGVIVNSEISKFTPTLSEKTYKAFHLMRPALIFGGYRTKEKLNQLGFDTWDWLIDWNFNYESDSKESFKLYLKELKRLLSFPVEYHVELIVQNKQSLINNQNQIFKLINNYEKNFPLSI